MPPSTLLTLPYDIRHLIYTHLFPSTQQLHLQALSAHTLIWLREDTTPPLPISLLLTNRQLHLEASAYLYNTYMINILGLKADCLSAHQPLAHTMRAYARQQMHTTVLSNGAHSATVCITLHVGEAGAQRIRARKRGQLSSLQALRAEVERDRPSQGRAAARLLRDVRWWAAKALGDVRRRGFGLVLLVSVVCAAVLAVLLGRT